MRSIELLLLGALLAGCASPGEMTAEPPASPPPTLALPPDATRVEGSGSIGWAIAVGSRQGFVGQFDKTHCPGLSFTLPPGVRSLHVSMDTTLSNGTGGGAYEAAITDPGGEERRLASLAGPSRWEGADPTAGEWTVILWPQGAVVQMTWTVRIRVDGGSDIQPAAFGVTSMCDP